MLAVSSNMSFISWNTLIYPWHLAAVVLTRQFNTECLGRRNLITLLDILTCMSTKTICCVICGVAHCKTAQVSVVHQTMEVQEQESLGRWDGLGSRDAISRVETMENIRQVVMKKVEAIKPIPSGAPSPPASGSPPSSDLNDILAHLLMLSKRCPFEDVRERSSRLLQSVQVRDSNYFPRMPFLKNMMCYVQLHGAAICFPILVVIVLFRRHLLLSSPPHQHYKHVISVKTQHMDYIYNDTIRQREVIST